MRATALVILSTLVALLAMTLAANAVTFAFTWSTESTLDCEPHPGGGSIFCFDPELDVLNAGHPAHMRHCHFRVGQMFETIRRVLPACRDAVESHMYTHCIGTDDTPEMLERLRAACRIQ